MSNPTGRVTGYSANGYSNPRDARQANSMGYGGYTGLDARQEALAQQFGREAQNGNFWRGAALWGTGAVVAGVGTVALERQWAKEGHSSYTDAKKQFLIDELSNPQKATLGIANGAEIDVKAVDKNFREGFVKNIFKGDANPYKGVNKVLNQANNVAKVKMNAFENLDPTEFAQKAKLTNMTGVGKAGLIAGAVLTGGLLISHLSASGEGNATTQMARQRLAQLKAEEGMA